MQMLIVFLKKFLEQEKIRYRSQLESMHEVGMLCIQRARDEEAEPLLLQAFHVRQTKIGPEHPHTVESLNESVRLYKSWGNPGQAVQYRARLSEKPEEDK